MVTGTYINNPTATTAILGQNSPAVGTLQTQLNTQNAKYIGKGWTPLAVDNKYGPLTQAGVAWKPTSQTAVDSSPSRLETAKSTSNLTAAMNALGTNQQQTTTTTEDYSQDPIVKALLGMQTTSDAATKNLLASSMASYQNQKNSVNKNYENYKAGLLNLGIEHNSAQGTPDLLAGQIMGVANEQTQKITDIDAEMHKVLIDSQLAIKNNEFKTIKDLSERYDKLKQAKTDAVKNMYDAISQQKSASADDIALYHSTIQGLSPKMGPNGEKSEQEQFLEALSKRDNIPLDGLVSALDEYNQTQKGKELTLAQKERTFNKSSTKTSGTLANAISKFTDTFESIKGTDKYVDPNQWINARTEWLQAGKSAASFNSNFKQYLNPLSYKLAGFKTSSSSGSGRSS